MYGSHCSRGGPPGFPAGRSGPIDRIPLFRMALYLDLERAEADWYVELLSCQGSFAKPVAHALQRLSPDLLSTVWLANA